MNKMQPAFESSIKSIITALAEFLLDRTKSPSKFYSNDPKIVHYYKEIIRYWNKLNFILRRNLLVLNKLSQFDQLPDTASKASFFYTTYRILWENASPSTVKAELKDLFTPLLSIYSKKIQTFEWKIALKNKDLVEQLSLEEAVPSFVIKHLQPIMNFNDIQANLAAMNKISKNTKFTVRMNTLIASELNISDSEFLDKIINALKQDGISFRQDQHIPALLHIPYEKISTILKTKIYKLGYLIIQDKASAAVIEVLAPKPEELIGDLCAAPGLKTSIIAQKTKNSAKILALDFHTLRIRQMKEIMLNLKVFNTQLLNSDSINPPFRPTFLFDLILLDAPCTGSGTFLINPEFKWRQTKSFLEQNTQLQHRLLEIAIKLLKVNGTLVYSTCSLYAEEGELQIMKFSNHLEPLNLPSWIAQSYTIGNKRIPGTGRLFPAIHKTQGFFICKFRKTNFSNLLS